MGKNEILEMLKTENGVVPKQLKYLESLNTNIIKLTKKYGATTAEIMEAYSVAKFSKSFSSISGFSASMVVIANEGVE